MTHSSGPWAHPPKRRASSSRLRVALIALALALGALSLAHVGTKAIANLAHFNATACEVNF